MIKKTWPLWLSICVGNVKAADPIALPEISVMPSWQTSLPTASSEQIESEQLFTQSQHTLGAALAKLPGVQNDSFGVGAGRPILRGQGAPRVKVLRNGANIMDASSSSPDHANAVEPLLAESVEIIRGPAALLYGNSAIGGVINVRSQQIARKKPVGGYAGSAAVLGSTVNDAHQGTFELTGEMSEHLVFQGAAALGRSHHYKAPKQLKRRIPDTSTEKNIGTVGISWVGKRGYLGVAATEHNSMYGLPAHSHNYEHCQPHNGSLHCHSHGHDHDEHDHGANLKLNSRRVNIEGEYQPTLSVWRSFRLVASYTDYQHDEKDDQITATQFAHTGGQLRVETEHAPWRNFHGTIGAEYSKENAHSAGLETLVPKIKTENIAIFALETLPLGSMLDWQTSARYEHQWLSSPITQQRQKGTASAATGLTWQLAPSWRSGFNISYTQRQANAQELYANGPHLATNTYECGLLTDECGAPQQQAKRETARGVEVSITKEKGAWLFNTAAYYQRVHNYIHSHILADHEGFRLVQYQQANVDFAGMEAESTWIVNPQWAIAAFTDHVAAKFVNGGRLPRIPAQRYGLRLLSFHSWLETEWELTRIRKQRHVGEGEKITPGYTELALTLNHYINGNDRYHIFLRGSNLLNQQQWQHASFLAHQVPEPGRNITAGIKAHF